MIAGRCLTLGGASQYSAPVTQRLVIVALTLLVAPSLARAQQAAPESPGAAAAEAPGNASELLSKAEAAYEQLEYEKALQLLVKVLNAQGVTDVQQARAYLYMGVCFTALGNAQNAVAAFVEVLKRRPDFRMPEGVSPSIRAMFEEALKQVPPPAAGAAAQGEDTGVALQARTPGTGTAGKPLKVDLELDDARRQVRSVAVMWRRRRGPDYSRVLVDVKPGQRKLSAMIPAAAVGDKPGPVLFFAEARDGEGKPLARAGSEEEPFEVVLAPAKGKSRRLGWWLLAIGGAAAVAGGVIAAVLLSRDDGSGNTVPPDTAHLTVILR